VGPLPPLEPVVVAAGNEAAALGAGEVVADIWTVLVKAAYHCPLTNPTR
jgi:hypothetical protein